jgi:sugar lactone lactonase YvrE
MLKRRWSWLLAALGALATQAGFAAPSSEHYELQRLVPASAFHGVHGLAFDREDVLYAGSVVGHSIYRVDTKSGKVESVVGAPEGMADDLVFLADGTLVWTSILHGVVRARTGNGPIRTLAKLVSVNSVNVRRSDGRLFVGQVFGGDGVWELDPSGAKPPRNIVNAPGGLNGFDIGPDGMLYGPLWFKRQVVRIDPDSGEMQVVAEGFETPAAVNFDSKWNLYVLDTARGEVIRVDIETGAKHLVAKLETALDNLAIDSKDRLFVSNMADNGIQEVDVRTGAARQVVKGALASPVAIASAANGGNDTLYVADVFAFRSIDGRTGAVTDIARSHAARSPIGYAIGVAANDRHIILTNSEGPVQRYDRRTLRLLDSWPDLKHAQNAIELPDGTLVLAETTAGRLMKVSTSGSGGVQPTRVLEGLRAPFGLAIAGEGEVYVAEMMGGQLLRVNAGSGASNVVAKGLDRPQGIAVAGDGSVLVLEVARKQLTRIDPKTGTTSVLARDLPVGLENVPITTAGVAAGANGVIYVTSDAENSIWKLVPKR